MSEEFDFEKAIGQMKSIINDEKTFPMAIHHALIMERNISTCIYYPRMRSVRHLKLSLCHSIWNREIVSNDVPSWMGEYKKATAVADPGEEVVDPHKFRDAEHAVRTSAEQAIKIIANIEKEGAPPARTGQPPTGPKPPTETKAAVSAKPAPPAGPGPGDAAPGQEASKKHPEPRPGAPSASSLASAFGRQPSAARDEPVSPLTPSWASRAPSGAPPRPPAGLEASRHNPDSPRPPLAPLPALDAVFGAMPANWDEGSSAKTPPSRHGDVAARTNDADGLWVGRDGNPLPNLPCCKGNDIPLPADVDPDRIFTAETKDQLRKMLGVYLKIVRESPNRGVYKLRIQEHRAFEGLPEEFRRHLRSRTDEFASDVGRLTAQMAGRKMYPSGLKIPSNAKPQTAAAASLGSCVKGGADKQSTAAGGTPEGRPTKDDLRKAFEGVWARHAADLSGIPEGKRSGLADDFAFLAVTRGSDFSIPGMLQALEQKVMWPRRVQVRLSSKAEEHDLLAQLCCYFILEVALEGHKAQLARHSSDMSAAANTTHTVETVSVRPVVAAGAQGDGENQRLVITETLTVSPAGGSAPPDSEKGEESRKEGGEAEAQTGAEAGGENKWETVKGSKPKKQGK
ncbi:hypothetical protein DL766_003545 [Monosporascus sp. MC13-8B]|nr:hypothetical protein DL766_003545 [Monosporascus sp. MC13-8B]